MRARSLKNLQPTIGTGLSGPALRGAGVTGGYFVLSQVITFATYVAIARLVTPAEFGDFAAGSALVALGLLVAESGISAALVRRKDRTDEAAATATVATLLGGLLISMLTAALAPVIGWIVNSRDAGLVALAVSGVPFLQVAGAVPYSLLQRDMAFHRRAVLAPVNAVAFGGVACATCALGWGVWGLVAGMYAGAAIGSLTAWRLARYRPRFALASIGMWRELARFGRHVFASEALAKVGTSVDVICVGGLLGPAAAGQYRYAFRVASQPEMVVTASAGGVLYPIFTRLTDDAVRLRDGFRRSMRSIAAVSFPLSALLLAAGVPIMVLFFGEAWRPASHALVAMSLLVMGRSLAGCASELWKAAGVPQRLTVAHGIFVVVLLGGIVLLSPLGLTAASASMSAASLAMGGYALVNASRVVSMSLRESASELLRPGIASIALVITVVILDQLLEPATRSAWPGLPLLTLELACGIVGYASVYRVAGLTRRNQGHVGVHTADPDVKVLQGQQPMFSVVMPAFNSERTIATAIRSVQRQTRSDFEVLVVDDGSTDRTAAVVEGEQVRDGRVRLFRSSHSGPSHARNIALSKARGAYISLLDSDDVYLPSYLETMHATLTANARAAIAMTDAWQFEDAFGRLKRRTALSTSPALPSDPRKLFELLLEDNHVFGLVMMRRSLVDNLGGFDERRRVPEDYEYWLRAVSIGARIIRAPGIHAVYRLSPASISAYRRKRLEDRAFMYRIVETEYTHLDVEVRERARRRRLQAERELACLTRVSPDAAVFRLRQWARSRAGAIRRQTMPHRVWMEMPPDVAGALDPRSGAYR